MCFADFPSCIDLIVQDYHHSLTKRFRFNAYPSAAPQVTRTIEVRFGCVTLSTDEDNRFAGRQRQVEKPRGLFKGIGAMGHQHTHNILASQCSLNLVMKLDPAQWPHFD
ncbi:hypothetical protein D3C80_1443250 [compost metagenome]